MNPKPVPVDKITHRQAHQGQCLHHQEVHQAQADQVHHQVEEDNMFTKQPSHHNFRLGVLLIMLTAVLASIFLFAKFILQ